MKLSHKSALVYQPMANQKEILWLKSLTLVEEKVFAVRNKMLVGALKHVL